MTAALILGCTSCDGPQAETSRALHELERLVFVPPSPCRLEGLESAWSDCALESALLVDRFEVSRRDWQHYYGERGLGAGFLFELGGLDEGRLEWPAFGTQADARALAQRRGMRLLSGREWLHVALGPRFQDFPWGSYERTSAANTLELGLDAPAPVGSFENGRSLPYGCYDVLGNVWEWVDGRVPGQDASGTFGGAYLALPDDGLTSVMGGGFRSNLRPTFGSQEVGPPLVFHARTVDRRTVSPEIGMRCCADAAPYLFEQAPAWGAGAEVERRLRGVARRWAEAVGREPVLTLLDEVRARPGAHGNLDVLVDELDTR